MTGRYEGYFDNIISAKEAAQRKKKEKEIAERMARLNKRLKKPLIKSKGRANMKKGIKTLWDTI